MPRTINQSSPKYRAVVARASAMASFDYHRLSVDCHVSVEMVRLIVADLIRIGWVEEVASKTMRKRFRMRPKSKRFNMETPQDKMWRSMRHLKFWTIDDLLMHSRTDMMVISDKEAADYVTALLASGYLKEAPRKPKEPSRYRLVRNTGPTPPVLVDIRVLWDDNVAQYGALPEFGQ